MRGAVKVKQIPKPSFDAQMHLVAAMQEIEGTGKRMELHSHKQGTFACVFSCLSSNDVETLVDMARRFIAKV